MKKPRRVAALRGFVLGFPCGLREALLRFFPVAAIRLVWDFYCQQQVSIGCVY